MRAETYQRLMLGGTGIIAICLSIIVTTEYLVPLLADRYFEKEYRRLAIECDQAMHDEAALRTSTAGTTEGPLLRLSADVQLIACHEYDKIRKRMLVLGVSEERLALHNLEALEVEQIPVRRLVEPHRMDHL